MKHLILLFTAALALHAETGRDAWLRYAALDEPLRTQYRDSVPPVVAVLGESPVEATAQAELIRGVRGMLGRIPRAQTGKPVESAIVLGTLDEIRRAAPEWKLDGALAADGFWLKTVLAGRTRFLVIAAANDRGVLYGAFTLLRKMTLGDAIATLDEKQTPYNPVRWVNQWDNLEGTIERGYGGRSIFWENSRARADLTRVSEYGRLLASLGINGCSITNVNANPRLLSAELLPDIARIAAAFRPWGVRVVISVDFGSPKAVGGLDTFDPVDPKVAAWWKTTFDTIYAGVPDLGGVVLKADSEGRVGPSTYGRTHADAANVVARGLAPHNGLLFYRGFVYDHHMDWNNPKNDRARASYDNFHELDGKFDDNVLIQIKNGPIDFQVREPASPLFAGLSKTNQAIEVQVTQEYSGQAKHTVFLIPQFKDTLDFDLHANGSEATPVKALVSGKVFKRSNGGMVGVVNVGLDDNWFGNHMSQANLYGFGRLAWNPDLTSEKIADEWTKLSFGRDPQTVATITSIQMSSWKTFEDYTGPLGLQTLTDITGNHYGVNVEASERNGWGQWHRADEKGVGMDRSVATGTGFAGQFPAPVAKVYESLATTPDNLLLFFHHVPYNYKLRDGNTVIQYLYDSHFRGADAVAEYVRQWKTLSGKVDEQRYRDILTQLEYQAGQAVVWRDAVTNWFRTASSIEDAKGRVGHYAGRFEAEGMKLTGYTESAITPQEDASGGKAVSCRTATGCTASMKYAGEPGWFDLHVEYFDQSAGVGSYRVFVNNQLVEQWSAELRLPSARLDSTTSTRRAIAGLALRPGDEIRIEGKPGGGDTAALDYIEIKAAGK